MKADPEGFGKNNESFLRVQVPGAQPEGSGFWVCGVFFVKGGLGALHAARASLARDSYGYAMCL